MNRPSSPARPGAFARRSRRRALRRRDAGVADVISTVLTVGITVLMAAGFVLFLLAAKPGPIDEVHADLAMTLAPGDDELWGTSDDQTILSHRGGEPLHTDITRLRVSTNGAVVTYEGATLSASPVTESGFTDGKLTLGERWVVEGVLNTGTHVAIDVVQTGGDGQLVVTKEARVPVFSCSSDTNAPTVQLFTQSPTDLTTLSGNTDVTVTARLIDDCFGVDESVDPSLAYKLTSDPGFTSVTMNKTGTRTWQGTIPDLDWELHPLESLQYKTTGMTDRGGNAGESPVQSDEIGVAGTETYVLSPFTDNVGTSDNDDNARSDTPAGNFARLTEEAAGGTATATFSAGTAVSLGTFSPGTSAGSSNDTYDTTTAGNPNAIRYPLADPTQSGAIASVVVKAEVSITGYANDQWTLAACLATCVTSANIDGQSADATIAFDVSGNRPGGGAWSWADIQGLEVQVNGIKNNARDGTWRIDHVYVEVGYGATTYDLDVELDFDPLPGGATAHVLEVRYRVTTSETFSLQISGGPTLTLDSTSFVTLSRILTPAEIAAGPHLRIVDVHNAPTAQGVLDLEYVRVVSF